MLHPLHPTPVAMRSCGRPSRLHAKRSALPALLAELLQPCKRRSFADGCGKSLRQVSDMHTSHAVMDVRSILLMAVRSITRKIVPADSLEDREFNKKVKMKFLRALQLAHIVSSADDPRSACLPPLSSASFVGAFTFVRAARCRGGGGWGAV